jgi:hypothetical protein
VDNDFGTCSANGAYITWKMWILDLV